MKTTAHKCTNMRKPNTQRSASKPHLFLPPSSEHKLFHHVWQRSYSLQQTDLKTAHMQALETP